MSNSIVKVTPGIIHTGEIIVAEFEGVVEAPTDKLQADPIAVASHYGSQHIESTRYDPACYDFSSARSDETTGIILLVIAAVIAVIYYIILQ